MDGSADGSGQHSKAQHLWSTAQLWSFSQGQHPLSDTKQRLMAPPGGICRDPARCKLKRNEASLSDPKGLPRWLSGKESACSAGDTGLISGLGRSPGEANGNPLQYSCLEKPTDRGAWQATIQRVAKSRTRLSDLAHAQSISMVC